jgi:hypothetical protein
VLALSSDRLGVERADLLARAAEVAGRLGFRAVHAARPPRDAARARPALERRGLALHGVAAPPLEGIAAVAGAAARASEAAAALRTRVAVLDGGDLAVPAGRSVEAEVEALARAMHGALAAAPGATIALRPAGPAGRLCGFRECGWLLDALASKAFGLWLDPVRAAAGPVAALDWADRYASRTVGIALHAAHGADWGTLRGLVPSRALRVLYADPTASDEEVVDARRRFEEALGW